MKFQSRSLLLIKISIAVMLVFLIITVNSCEKNNALPAPVPTGCDTANLTYTNSMQLLININCGSYNTGCHAPGVSDHGDFSNYASLQRYATGGEQSFFYRYIFIQKKMPESPELPLDACTSAKFKAWILAGAPQ
jgi:hypothetical protein